ncbi:MAG: hypothetical protein LBB88_01095 [Planctomycetaceae bacterium]|jgi:hypothetical protein|nr:hypothetical protein [Planctomycetaceae bacterium]
MKTTKSKKKKSFDIKQFFIQHGEKFVVGLLVLIAIFFIYLGITSYQSLAWQPADLDNSAQSSRNFIDTNSRTASDEKIGVFQYDKYAEWIKFGIKLELYATPSVWLPLLFPERIKRDKVPLLPVENLIASAGLGAISIKPTGGKTQIGERWAIVTGLIPIRKQREFYVRAYAASVRPAPERDTPFYVSYELERAEIIPDQDDKNLKWEKIEAFKELNKRLTTTWNGVANEPVDPDFLAPYTYLGPESLPMACPLPPKVKPFGKEVTQNNIPLLSETTAEWQKKSQEYNQNLQKELEQKGESGVSFKERSPWGNRGDTNQPFMQPKPNRTSSPDSNLPPEEERVIENFLLRYLDYTVVPGKTYRYRVKLTLANPNYGMSEGDVVSIDITKEAYLDTDVSNASNKVTIPPDSRILARSVLPPSRTSPWLEPSANVLGVYFDLADGSEWVWGANEKVYRGSTINIKDAVTQNPLMLDKAETRPRPGGARPTNPTTAQSDPKLQPQRKDVITNACIIDITGGVVLGNATTVPTDAPTTRTPGKILVVNNMGELSIHDIGEDNNEIESMKSIGTDTNNPLRRMF